MHHRTRPCVDGDRSGPEDPEAERVADVHRNGRAADGWFRVGRIGRVAVQASRSAVTYRGGGEHGIIVVHVGATEPSTDRSRLKTRRKKPRRSVRVATEIPRREDPAGYAHVIAWGPTNPLLKRATASRDSSRTRRTKSMSVALRLFD